MKLGIKAILTVLMAVGSVTKQAKTGGVTMRRLAVAVMAVVLGLGMFAGVAGAGQITWIGGTGNNWSTGANWTGGVVPGSADEVILNYGGAATINSDVGTIADTIGMNIGNTMLINMESGGSLIVTDTYEMGRGNSGNTTFNMTGGSFTAGSMYLTSHNTGTNQLTISGGTFAVTGALETLHSGGWANAGTHTLTVSGDAASITAGSVNMINNYGAGSMATTLAFDFDSDGISTMDVTGAFTAGDNSLLVIDLANYVYTANQTFTLVDSTALTAFDVGNISVLNPGTLGYIVSQADNNIAIEVLPNSGTVLVDIGRSDQSAIESGWYGWELNGDPSYNNQTANFGFASATDGSLDVTVSGSGNYQIRNYGLDNVTDSGNLDITNVWRDQWFNNSGGDLSLVLDDLKAGRYSFTSYHFADDLEASGGNNDEATASVYVNGVDTGQDVTFVTGNPYSASPSAAEIEAEGMLSMNFTVASDDDTVTIKFDDLTGGDSFGLNGFQLEFRPAGTVISIR